MQVAVEGSGAYNSAMPEPDATTPPAPSPAERIVRSPPLSIEAD